uniref:Reverse transcriptase domain-containing protein n=1 Tax=Bracon brevicornis TaxID=1563983 RepID=A0A6V7KRT2_9HYME
MEPAQFCTISISSVILRHFHRVLASRLMALPLLNEKQWAFINADGIAESDFVMAMMINEANEKLRQLHMSMIDVKKAFDTVYHNSIRATMMSRGLPNPLTEYVMNMCTHSVARLEVDGQLSAPIHPRRGVGQGDSLSSFIFNLGMDNVINAIPSEVGLSIGSTRVNCLAFANDLVLVAEIKQGLQLVMDCVVNQMRKCGLSSLPTKRQALSLVPSGREKEMKVISEPTFVIEGQQMKQIGIEDS